MRRASVTAVLVAILAIPGVAFAEDPAVPPNPPKAEGGVEALTWGMTEADAALMQEQVGAVAIADQLTEAVSDLPGFTGITLDGGAVVLRWKGRPPAAVLDLVASLGSQREIRVESARYTRAELRKAAAKVRSVIESGQGHGVHAVAINPDGSGLTVRSDNASATERSAAVKATQAAAGAIPTTFTMAERAHSYSRENDYAPWAGGAAMINRNSQSALYTQACSTGFGVKTPSGAPYILTAAHCGLVGDTFKDPTGETIGKVKDREDDLDVMLVTASSVVGEIYVGAGILNPGTQGIKGVSGWAYPYYGQSVCASGAYTGNLCSLTVNSTEEYRCDVGPLGWQCWGPLARAHRSNNGNAFNDGDSGGPVYFANGSRAGGVGTIVGGTSTGDLYFASIGGAVSRWNLTVLTRSY